MDRRVQVDGQLRLFDLVEDRPTEPEMVIFVCSPLRASTVLGVEENLLAARLYCEAVSFVGKVPIAPHLLFPQFLDDDSPVQRERGIAMGLKLLERCDALYAFGVLSEGMRREVDAAGVCGLNKTIRFFPHLRAYVEWEAAR